jgi:hypothetical protein
MDARRRVSRRSDDLARGGIAYMPFFPLGGVTPLQSSTLSDVARRRLGGPCDPPIACARRTVLSTLDRLSNFPPRPIYNVSNEIRRDEMARPATHRRSTMKTVIAVLTFTTLIGGIATANAQPQGSNEAAGYALSLRMAAPSAYASAWVPSAYASARVPARHPTVSGTGYDFQLQGR